jgi:hypothetical protein
VALVKTQALIIILQFQCLPSRSYLTNPYESPSLLGASSVNCLLTYSLKRNLRARLYIMQLLSILVLSAAAAALPLTSVGPPVLGLTEREAFHDPSNNIIGSKRHVSHELDSIIASKRNAFHEHGDSTVATKRNAMHDTDTNFVGSKREAFHEPSNNIITTKRSAMHETSTDYIGSKREAFHEPSNNIIATKRSAMHDTSSNFIGSKRDSTDATASL